MIPLLFMHGAHVLAECAALRGPVLAVRARERSLLLVHCGNVLPQLGGGGRVVCAVRTRVVASLFVHGPYVLAQVPGMRGPVAAVRARMGSAVVVCGEVAVEFVLGSGTRSAEVASVRAGATRGRALGTPSGGGAVPARLHSGHRVRGGRLRPLWL